jgi:hypothetical protein
MRALELLRKCGVLSLNGASTSSSKGLAYNKVLPEDLSVSRKNFFSQKFI